MKKMKKGWKVKILRPEEIYGSPEKYYTEEEILKYASSSHMRKTQQKLAKRIAELLNAKPPAKVLDLGCGVGYSMQFFKEMGFEVIGIDILDKMLEFAKQRGLNVKKVDMRELPFHFTEKEFDYVISTSALQWIEIGEMRKVAKGCYYVLKDNGKLGIQFYPRSEEEMLKVGKIFKKAGFNIRFVIDKPNIPKKRTIYMIGEKREESC